MLEPEMPRNEDARAERLRDLLLLDRPSDPFYDQITELAARLFDVPTVLVVLVDSKRAWFKARVGFDWAEIPRNISFCAHAILASTPTVVRDTHDDIRFIDNPLVTQYPHLRFYAGVPLITKDGFALGALCLKDTVPRPHFGENEVLRLEQLASLVMSHISALESSFDVDFSSGLPNRVRFSKDVLTLSANVPAAGCFTHAVMIELLTPHAISRIAAVMPLESVTTAVVVASKRLEVVLPAGTILYKVHDARWAFFARDGLDDVFALCRRCIAAFTAPVITDAGVRVKVNPVAAIATLISLDPRELLRALIAAAEKARQRKLSIIPFENDMLREQERAFHILASFATALASDGQLRLVYQPRERLSDGVCVGAEALIRWKHPLFGELGPIEFLPIIEETSLMAELTDWVLDKAVSQLAAWKQDFPQLDVSVNISASDLTRDAFSIGVRDTLLRHAVPASRLELEVTESAVLLDVERGVQMLRQLRQTGVTIAIDDFGSGYSNMAQLKHLEADVLKIDQSLVRSMMDSERDTVIVKTSVTLAHALGCRVVVEGVESEMIKMRVAEWGCEEVQGYHISRPLESADFFVWLKKREAKISIR